MTVVSDFQVIRDNPITIGDGRPVLELNFNTGGRRTQEQALITFMVRGLTVATAEVDVRVNNKVVGSILPHTGGDDSHYYTQTIVFSGADLRDGNNEFEVRAAPLPGGTGGNAFDDYRLRSVICFFHQDA